MTKKTQPVSEEDKHRRSDIAQKALRTAKWGRIMTKWMITHATSSKGVKWQVVSFNGASGQESSGIVDMIAIRKNHLKPTTPHQRGDLFEIVLVQVKGGSAKFPSQTDVDRLMAVKDHHRADKVVLTEWKKGEKLCCYVLPDMKNAVPAEDIFGLLPSAKKVQTKIVANVASQADK